MNIEEVREYCLLKPCTTEAFPFNEDALVFKVADKMFALVSLEKQWINLKCDPEKAIQLREHYSSVTPGYHMNKKYWNTVQLDGSVSSELLAEWIDHSYDLVVAKLPKNIRDSIL